MTTVHGTMLKLKTEELATWTPFQITPFICSCLFSLETSTVETRCLNLLMLSLAAQSPRLVKDSFLEDRQHPGNTGTDNQSSKCVGAENWPVLGIGEWRVTFGKVNVFLHSSLELQPKRSDHFLHKISCYTFLRADDKQAAEYGLGRMPTRSSCLWCFITLAKGRERRATVAAGLQEHGGTGGTWHSDVGFFHTAVGGFCVDSWGLWSTASAEGIRNSLGYSVLLSFFHRRGKILNNWDPVQFWCFCEVLARAELGELLCYHECLGTRISSFCRRSSDFHRRMAVCTGAVRGVARTTPWSNNSEAWWKINEQRENMEGIVAT